MTKPIVRLYLLVMVLIGILVFATSWWTVFGAKGLRDNPRNRRELLDVLVTREVEGYMDVLRRAAFSPHPVTEDELRAQMQSVTADLIGLAMNRIDVSAFLLTDVAGVDKETLRRHLRHFHELSGLAAEVLANAAAEGLIDESISLEFAGQAWISAILAVVTPAVADDSDVGDVDEVARILTRVLLDGIPTPTA